MLVVVDNVVGNISATESSKRTLLTSSVSRDNSRMSYASLK